MHDTGPRGQADGRFERFEAWRMSAGEATPICESCELAAEAPLVIEVDGRTVGDGTPGPIFRKILEHFRVYANSHGEPIYED